MLSKYLDAASVTFPYAKEEWLHVRIIFPHLSVFYSDFNSSYQECDAMIITTSYIYESMSIDAMKQWFSDVRKEVHILGPLLPAGYGTEIQNIEEGAGNAIEEFLKEMLVQHGKRSVFFVRSFSSF